MFGMGMGELVIIAIVALLALGPDRLPGAAKKIGKTIRDLRRQTSQLKKTIEEDSQLGDAMKEIKQALRDDPFRDPPERPKPAKTKSVTKRDGASAPGDGTDDGDKPGGAETDGADAEAAGADDGDAAAGIAADGDASADSGDPTDSDEPAVQAAAEAVPVEPRMINMSEFQKYVHMWGPAAAAEKYGTSLEEAEAAIEAVVSQAAASKRDADG